MIPAPWMLHELGFAEFRERGELMRVDGGFPGFPGSPGETVETRTEAHEQDLVQLGLACVVHEMPAGHGAGQQ